MSLHQVLLSFAFSLITSSRGVAAPASIPSAERHEAAASTGAVAPRYEDLVEHLSADDARRGRLWRVRDNLETAFDYICGDTFCEGEYSNLRSLSFQCSVDATTERLSSCLWTFAGSVAFVDPGTGSFVERSSRVFECAVPMNGLTVDELLTSLEGEHRGMAALEKPLGTAAGRPGPSFYDALLNCL